ncbi:MAG TPA: lipid-binding SYLF domain-containing protein [Burkholderiales bacterium]
MSSIDYAMEEATMRVTVRNVLAVVLLVIPLSQALADDYADTINVFRKAGESSQFFSKSYGYAVFPTIGKGGFVVGGAHGNGRVYAKGTPVGESSMTQLTVGAQLGGQAYSQIIFFEDKRAFEQFTSGNFEFSAQATAVAITAGASAQAGTTGASAGASGTQSVAKTKARYYRGMAVFTVAKGGLMYEASIGGQKFSYAPLKK